MPISGSNPDLSAKSRMPIRLAFWIALFMALTPLVASAAPIDDYIRVRRQYGISEPVGTGALETLLGERVVEVQGVVCGVIGQLDDGYLMLSGNHLAVRMKSIPECYRATNYSVRMIVKATRLTEGGILDAESIAIIDEDQMRGREAAERARLESAKKPSRKAAPSKQSRGALVSRSPVVWSVSLEEALPYYAAFIQKVNKRIGASQATEIAKHVLAFSQYYGVDARLIMAMVLVESGFNTNAVSRAGARGLGQIMPGTGRGMGVRNLHDPAANLYATTRIIRGHLEKYGKMTGDSYRALVLTIAAYNAGSGAVKKYGGVPPYRETQNHVRKVVATYKALAGLD